MNLRITLFGVAILAGWLTYQSPLPAQQNPASAEKPPQKVDVRALLEKGRASSSLPKSLVIRVSCCLGSPREKTPGKPIPEEMRETWEFTSDQIRLVGSESKVESRAFDSKNLCKELLEGKAIEIGEGRGQGPELGFVGTHYQMGSRSIELVWNGETILHLYETNGPFLKFYRETDARAFGTLHGKLAGRARALFESKSGEPK